MNAIRATVRNGRVETDAPLDLPEGTELLLVQLLVAPSDDPDDDWDDSPEGVRAWLEWFDSLKPLIFTEEERAAFVADRQARRDWELAHADERAEKLRRMWE